MIFSRSILHGESTRERDPGAKIHKPSLFSDETRT